MKIGDKLREGYSMLVQGDWEGAYILYSTAGDLFMLDAIDEIIFQKLSEYVKEININREDTEANQWLKIFLLDARYAGFLLKPGDLLENMIDLFNKYPEIEDHLIVQHFLDGQINKLKYADNAFFCINKDYKNGQTFLIRVDENGERPLDFDVKDFELDRAAKRIKYRYTRGTKGIVSIDYMGENKKITPDE